MYQFMYIENQIIFKDKHDVFMPNLRQIIIYYDCQNLQGDLLVFIDFNVCEGLANYL